jgi:hypothetical protein
MGMGNGSQDANENSGLDSGRTRRFVEGLFLDGYPSIPWKDMDGSVQQLSLNELEKIVPYCNMKDLAKLFSR